jgi:cytochrome c oxidase subunit 3
MTITAGFLFLALQILLWKQVSDSGIHLYTGAYGSIFYMMTWFHAVHIVGGLAALIYITTKISRGLTPEEGLLRTRLIAIFWHFLVIVWVAIFLLIFVI